MDVVTHVIFGTAAAVEAVLVNRGRQPSRINTAFVASAQPVPTVTGTRGRCGRRIASRRTVGFIVAVTFFTMYSYNFCWTGEDADQTRNLVRIERQPHDGQNRLIMCGR